MHSLCVGYGNRQPFLVCYGPVPKHLLRNNGLMYLMLIEPCIIVIVEEHKTNLMSLAILFHFLCAQHVLDINIAIIRSW